MKTSALLYNLQRLREEELHFKVVLDSALAETHSADIAEVLDEEAPVAGQDDTLILSYSVSIQYWNNIAKKLQALNRILGDPKAVLSVDTVEINHGLCVVEDLFNTLAAVKRAIAKR